ncbi:hypothetical protein [Tumebacillus flagellatus]|nr:hypothetical protein [Tumebacillus flagellatus]
MGADAVSNVGKKRFISQVIKRIPTITNTKFTRFIQCPAPIIIA